jgi:hypothetical protein
VRRGLRLLGELSIYGREGWGYERGEGGTDICEEAAVVGAFSLVQFQEGVGDLGGMISFDCETAISRMGYVLTSQDEKPFRNSIFLSIVAITESEYALLE